MGCPPTLWNSSKGKQRKRALVVTEQDNELIRFYDEKGNRLSLEDHGVLVPKSYADQYHIAEGIRSSFNSRHRSLTKPSSI